VFLPSAGEDLYPWCVALTVTPKVRARSWGSGTAAVVRFLVAADHPMSGVAIARGVGVTQPRASQILKQLTALDALRTTSAGYVGRRARLMDLYADRARPALMAPETVWYSTRTLIDQARRISAHVAKGDAAFSADLGPDLLVPWRHPTVAIVYSAKQLDLAPVGFVPAEGRSDASVVARWTSDATLLCPSPGWPGSVEGLRLVDPVQQWADLVQLGGEDRREGAQRLRRAILDRTIGAGW
jgi:hypothetical protein